jgi:hypothetical protein
LKPHRARLTYGKIILKARRQRLLELEKSKTYSELSKLVATAFESYARGNLPVLLKASDGSELSLGNYFERDTTYGKMLAGGALTGKGKPGDAEASMKMYLANLTAGESNTREQDLWWSRRDTSSISGFILQGVNRWDRPRNLHECHEVLGGPIYGRYESVECHETGCHYTSHHICSKMLFSWRRSRRGLPMSQMGQSTLISRHSRRLATNMLDYVQKLETTKLCRRNERGLCRRTWVENVEREILLWKKVWPSPWGEGRSS